MYQVNLPYALHLHSVSNMFELKMEITDSMDVTDRVRAECVEALGSVPTS